MSKLAKETPVYIPCTACGKVQRAKLKWVHQHKTLECEKCGESINLKKDPARTLISQTGVLEAAFEKALEVVHEHARQIGKSLKAGKPVAKRPKPHKERRLAGRSRAVATASTPVSTPAADGQVPV